MVCTNVGMRVEGAMAFLSHFQDIELEVKDLLVMILRVVCLYLYKLINQW